MGTGGAAPPGARSADGGERVAVDACEGVLDRLLERPFRHPLELIVTRTLAGDSRRRHRSPHVGGGTLPGHAATAGPGHRQPHLQLGLRAGGRVRPERHGQRLVVRRESAPAPRADDELLRRLPGQLRVAATELLDLLELESFRLGAMDDPAGGVGDLEPSPAVRPSSPTARARGPRRDETHGPVQGTRSGTDLSADSGAAR